MMNQQTVTVNGHERIVTNHLSSGPGQPFHTYELTGGDYIYEIGGYWWLQQPGQLRRFVTVTVTR